MSGAGAFEASTPADAQTNPWRGLGDHERRPAADDAGGLAEDDLEPPRVAVGAGEPPGLVRRLDLVQADDAPLGLRDHLLGDADDVAVAQLHRSRDQRREIVALGDLGEPLDRQDLDHARAASRTASASRRAARRSRISVAVTCGRMPSRSTAAAPSASARSTTSASISPA